MSELETLNKLYDGQITTIEAVKLLNLPSSEETIKILDMIKSHKVTAQDGKELLEAVSVKQTEQDSNSGRRRVRTLGVVTLVFGAFLFLLSIIIVPLTLFSPINSDAIRMRGEAQRAFNMSQEQKMENELRQHLEEGLKKEGVPGPIGNMGDFRLKKIGPQHNEDFEKQMQNLSNNKASLILGGLSAFTLWVISILMMIYAIGLILLTHWGRKTGIAVSYFTASMSVIITVFFIFRILGSKIIGG